ncbi:hypothetical protein ACRALDRAFT_1068422 [Sodiomyces alcalophilus JCM 7366]|uniref:uncharacterized protein n=1 Tax=Sodiomyces alcalophilus JCM 7366 TaxID=591952 RepID=UPI0039B5489A
MDSDTKMTEAPNSRLLDPKIFEHLKNKIDEDQQVRDALSLIIQRLDRANSHVQGLLSRVHATPRSQYPSFLAQVEAGIQDEIAVIGELNEMASQHPYYQYNQKWARTIQNSIFTVLLCGWLGGLPQDSSAQTAEPEQGRLITIEEVGSIFKVPVNLKDRDSFHITIEEYLFALVDLTQELSRLAPNAVTLGEPALSIRVASFVGDIFAGFQVLNLKNDALRKRVDGVKYHVQRVEEVVYDLTLRGMVPKGSEDPDKPSSG